MILQAITAIGSIASTWISGKAEEAKVKQEVRLKAIQSEENWEKIQAENSQSSWKDEWFTIVLSIPMIGAFIPSLVPYIQEGFRVLDAMPEYYKGFLAAAIAASFGIKALSNWRK
jgi:hypothetical protein